MLKLLTGLNNIQLWSHELGTASLIKSGMFVAIHEGKIVLPGAHKGPFYMAFGNSNVPSVKGSGAMSLVYGLCRIETDQVAADTYAPGMPVTANAAGLITPAEWGDYIVGVVEAVLSGGALRLALTFTRSVLDMAIVTAVIDLIDALPTVETLALADAGDVTAARAAYDALPTSHKDDVTNRADLFALEAQLEVLAGEVVLGLIDALPSVEALTLADTAAVEAARTAYEALSEAAKAAVTNLDDLVALEAQLEVLAVIALISALPLVADLTLGDEADITAAVAAHTALSEAQKSGVTNYGDLEALVAELARLQGLVTLTGDVTLATVNNAAPASIYDDSGTLKNEEEGLISGGLVVDVVADVIEIGAEDYEAVFNSTAGVSKPTGLQLALTTPPVGANYFTFLESLDSLKGAYVVGELASSVALRFIDTNEGLYVGPKASGTVYLVITDDVGDVLEVRPIAFTTTVITP